MNHPIEVCNERKNASAQDGQEDLHMGHHHRCCSQNGQYQKNRDSGAHLARKEEMECFFRHKKGHVQVDCFCNTERKKSKDSRNEEKGKVKKDEYAGKDHNPRRSWRRTARVLATTTICTENQAEPTRRNYWSIYEKMFGTPDGRCQLLLNSRATNHVCSAKRLCGGLLYRTPKIIIVGNGESMVSTRGDQMRLKNDKGEEMLLWNVTYCFIVQLNAISVSQVERRVWWKITMAKWRVNCQRVTASQLLITRTGCTVSLWTNISIASTMHQ